MTVAELQEKVAKAAEKVEKSKKTIERHKAQLAKKIAAGAEAWEIEWKENDIKDAGKKLVENERILANWEEKLAKAIEKEDFLKNNVPAVVHEFLNAWKQMAYDWHIQRYEGLQELKAKLKDEGLKYREYHKKITAFAGAAVMHMDSLLKDEALTWLDRELEREKQNKMVDLIQRVQGYVGEITDASGLSISDVGNLNGIVNGTKGSAEVETIGAGGWNIQCFHYRTLVKPFKGQVKYDARKEEGEYFKQENIMTDDENIYN